MKQPLKTGFPPIADASARILILGSMPGDASLAQQQYYAHPRNAFWPIMESILGAPDGQTYDQRIAMLIRHGVALWDVLAACHRQGSLDSAIETETLEPNDFAAFFREHPKLEKVFFNGSRAEQDFERYVRPSCPDLISKLQCTRLPSTSPAMASLGFDEKLKQWSVIKSA